MSAASHSIRLTVSISPSRRAANTARGTLPLLTAPRRVESDGAGCMIVIITETRSEFNFYQQMPAAKKVINAFTIEDLHRHTGISLDMLDYLCRHGYLRPAYAPRVRASGKVRYFSYRDLVIASVVERLLATGVKLRRLKKAMKDLRQDHSWFPKGRRSEPIQWLVSDGRAVLLKHEDGFLDELRSGGQRAFAFVVNLEGIQSEVKGWLDPEKQLHFSMENLPMKIQIRKRGRAR